MTSETEETRTVQVELPKEQLDVIHELVLRGLSETDPTEREYGEAYDSFVAAADYPMRIGDQPDRVREVWEEVFGPLVDQDDVDLVRGNDGE